MMEVAAIPTNCIPANPDIAGVGIRVSVYAQGIWSVGITAWITRRGKVPLGRAHLVEAQATLVNLTSGALFSSAFIQAVTYGLSAYHAIIVLNLGWINFASVLLLRTVAHASQAFRHTAESPLLSVSPRLTLFRTFYFFASMSLFHAFGLWFWATVDTFGSTIQCATRLPIPIHILGHTILSNSYATRIVFLVVYGHFALALPFAVLLIVFTKVRQIRKPHGTYYGDRDLALGIVGICLSLGTLVGIIIGTEAMVRDAASFVQPGESEWTYGQTISMFLLAPGILEVFQALMESKKRSQPDASPESGGTDIGDRRNQASRSFEGV